jgi:hypothetical protein
MRKDVAHPLGAALPYIISKGGEFFIFWNKYVGGSSGFEKSGKKLKKLQNFKHQIPNKFKIPILK